MNAYRRDWQPPRNWENRPVVREPDRLVFGWLLKMCLLAVVAILPLGIYLVLMNSTLHLVYVENDQRERLQKLAEEERELRAELAALESLPEIERWALRERGLTLPAANRVTVVPAEPEPAGTLVAREPAARPATPDAGR